MRTLEKEGKVVPPSLSLSPAWQPAKTEHRKSKPARNGVHPSPCALYTHSLSLPFIFKRATATTAHAYAFSAEDPFPLHLSSPTRQLQLISHFTPFHHSHPTKKASKRRYAQTTHDSGLLCPPTSSLSKSQRGGKEDFFKKKKKKKPQKPHKEKKNEKTQTLNDTRPQTLNDTRRTNFTNTGSHRHCCASCTAETHSITGHNFNPLCHQFRNLKPLAELRPSPNPIAEHCEHVIGKPEPKSPPASTNSNH